MQKSIFGKYLRITMVIVLISFILLGSMMMIFFASYWRGEKKDLLSQNARTVSNYVSGSLVSNEDGGYNFDQGLSQFFIETLSKNIDADIFITDSRGLVVLGSYSNSKMLIAPSVHKEAIEKAMTDFFEGDSAVSESYNMKVYSIGVPIITEKGQAIGAVFAVTSAKTINEFQHEAMRIFLIASMGAFAATLLIVGAFSYSLVKPLRQMSAAARRFGTGDFSVRVPVNSTDEIGQLAVSFNSMINSLTNSEEMRRSFIANVSHELKTPMTTIAGFIDGILDGTIPENRQKEYLQIVSDEIKRLSRLVKSMLDLSKIDSGEMKLNSLRFDLTKTIFATLLTFEKSIEKQNIEIRGLDQISPQFIEGDPDLIHQVVYNLVENAVKFTNQNGYISLAVSDGIDRTTVVIENSGQGISPEDISMIFERFYKTDKSRSRDKNGMGLGLYIVRTIIKLHGGEINVSSVQGEYCRFEFYIPKRSENDKARDNTGKIRDNIPRKANSVKDAKIIADIPNRNDIDDGNIDGDKEKVDKPTDKNSDE